MLFVYLEWMNLNDTTGSLSGNHNFVPSLVHSQVSKLEYICMFVNWSSKSFIAQIWKFVSPWGKKLIFFSSIGFEIQNNYGSETLEFELHSFRAFQLYLTDKNQHMLKEQCQFFILMHIVFECTIVHCKLGPYLWHCIWKRIKSTHKICK